MARAGPLVPAPAPISDLPIISFPSFKIIHLEAVDPISIPIVYILITPLAILVKD
jgi:hypothetical protein